MHWISLNISILQKTLINGKKSHRIEENVCVCFHLFLVLLIYNWQVLFQVYNMMFHIHIHCEIHSFFKFIYLVILWYNSTGSRMPFTLFPNPCPRFLPSYHYNAIVLHNQETKLIRGWFPIYQKNTYNSSIRKKKKLS